MTTSGDHLSEASVRVHAVTDRGSVRERNEDAVGASRWSSQQTGAVASHLYSGFGPVVCAVADGLGGQRGGHVASALAVDELVHGPPPTDTDQLRDRLRQLHQMLVERGTREPELAGMATTIATVVVTADAVLCATVGDSRIYDLSTGSAIAVSLDDSPLDIDARLAGASSTVVTQALGGRAASLGDPHVQWLAREPGLVLLLCSDGLTSLVDEEEIAAAVDDAGGDAAAVERLVTLALERGAPDNVSTLIARIDSEGAGEG